MVQLVTYVGGRTVGKLAEREGLPHIANKRNKIIGLSLARMRRVNQSCAPKSSAYRLADRAKVRFGLAELIHLPRYISSERSFLRPSGCRLSHPGRSVSHGPTL